MKYLLKKLVRKIGFELNRNGINRFTVGASSMARLQRLFLFHKIDCILDVGANRGQFALDIRSAGYRGRIISFEPLSDAYQQLLTNSKKDPLWEIAPRAAIGAKDDEITINIAKNSWSSSILNMHESHVIHDPSSVYMGSEKVRLARLDSITTPYLRKGTRFFLKIDTQGYEAEVIDGATQILQMVTGLHIEISFVPLYEGQTLYREMIKKVEDLGFELNGISPGIADNVTGRLLQADGIFFRRDG